MIHLLGGCKAVLERYLGLLLQGVASSADELHQLEEEEFTQWQEHVAAAAAQVEEGVMEGAAADASLAAASAVGCGEGSQQQKPEASSRKQQQQQQQQQRQRLEAVKLQGDDLQPEKPQQKEQRGQQQRGIIQDPGGGLRQGAAVKTKGRRTQQQQQQQGGKSINEGVAGEGRLKGAIGNKVQQQQQQESAATSRGPHRGGRPHAPMTQGPVAAGDGGVVSFYEGRLEFWRQLWRTLELADVVLMVVDAR